MQQIKTLGFSKTLYNVYQNALCGPFQKLQFNTPLNGEQNHEI